MMGETCSHVSHNWILACQILRIVDSQVQIEMIFSLVRILTILRRCCLPLENLEKLIVELVGNPILILKLIGIDVDLEKELEQFEGAFERDETMDL